MKPTTIRLIAVVIGASLFSVGAGMIYLPAGLMTGGGILFLAGLVGHMRGSNE